MHLAAAGKCGKFIPAGTRNNVGRHAPGQDQRCGEEVPFRPQVCQQRNSALGACLFDGAQSLKCKSTLPTDRNAIQMQSEHWLTRKKRAPSDEARKQPTPPCSRAARKAKPADKGRLKEGMLMHAPVSGRFCRRRRGAENRRNPPRARHARHAGLLLAGNNTCSARRK